MDMKICDCTTILPLVPTARIDQICDFVRGHPAIFIIQKDLLNFFMEFGWFTNREQHEFECSDP